MKQCNPPESGPGSAPRHHPDHGVFMPSISVIFPVYNTEPYLPEALDSLAAQTIRDFELVAVNDGSTDRSGEILREYAGRFPQMKIITQKNRGHTAALNTGLRNADGQYIAFVDSDDWVAPVMLEHLLRTAEASGADLVQCGYASVYPDCTIPRQSLWACSRSGRRGVSLAECPELLFLDNVNCNKLYRRSMLDRFGIEFDTELKMAGDLPFFFQTLLTANRIAVTGDVLYFYRQQRAGQMTAHSSRNCFCVFRAYENTCRFIAEHRFDYIHPYLLHSALSLFAYMYEKLTPELQDEFFRRMNAYFRGLGIPERSPIPVGPWRGASLPDKIRWGMLRILHPAALRAILRERKTAYDRTIAARRFLLETFRKAASVLPVR